jgi:hypothetical protein
LNLSTVTISQSVWWPMSTADGPMMVPWLWPTGLLEYEGATGEQIELDIVALRCDFSEWGTLRAWWSDWVGYDKDVAERINALGLDEESSTEERNQAIRDYITDRGILIEFGSGIIVSSF